MTKEEAQQFVRKALAHAMARDGSSGGVIRMVMIDKTGVSFPGMAPPWCSERWVSGVVQYCMACLLLVWGTVPPRSRPRQDSTLSGG